MSDNDEFDNIINGLGDSDDDDSDDTVEDVEFENAIDVVAHFWKDLFPGSIFVKGIVIVESASPDGRALRYQTSFPTSEWEILGMLECVKQQLNAQGVMEVLTIPDHDDDDDE